jgi:processive 1,2-diacylglycerol beta-glucosyltransferase
MPNVLILTAATGGGHLMLAESVRDLLASDAHVDIVDPLPGFVRLHYRLVSRHARGMWAAEYSFTDRPHRALAVHRMWAALLSGSLRKLLQCRCYDLVITTFPFLSYEVLRAIGMSPRRTPFAMLLADPDRVHAAWLTERGAAATFAPTRETYSQAHSAGFAPDRLHLTGWPVRRQFLATDRSAARTATLRLLELDPHRLTLFVQGGGEGTADFARVADIALAAAPRRVQVILAVGTNRGLIKRFSGAAHVRTIPHTAEIAPFMAAAHIVMGKAGPNTLLEATTLGKPFMATTYIPGQEAPNLAFIANHGLGWIALKARDQFALIASIAAEPGRLRAFDETVNRYRDWNRAATAALPARVKSIMAGHQCNGDGGAS